MSAQRTLPTTRSAVALAAILLSPGAALAQVPVPAPLPPDPPKTGWAEPVPVVAVPAAAAPDAPSKAELAAIGNQPPRIEHILPQRFDRFEISVPVDKPLRLTVEAADPEGMPLRVSLVGAPEGAEFSEALRTLTWTPTARQRGQHVLRFVAFDGEKEASRVMTINVTENHAPTFLGEQPRFINVGDYGSLALTASDPEEDPLTYSASGLPRGATFDKATAMLTWRPSEADIGDHVVRVTASDGSLQTTSDITIHVADRTSQPEDEWESYFLPGLGYSMYRPRLEHLGTFSGPTLEILLAAWIHRNENRGPSHGRVYANVELLESDRGEDMPLLLSYALGFSLSLERNPRRNFLIPSYGVDFGGMSNDYMGGSHFQSTPYVALHLFSNQNVFVNARAGYRIVPSDMERLAGLHASATADFSVW